MIALPIPLQLLPAFSALLAFFVFCLLVGSASAAVYRWTVERHEADRRCRLSELHAFAEAMRRQGPLA